jgi:hypothetical protein
VPYPPLFLLIRPSLALALHRHRLQILLSSIRVLIFEHTVHGGPQCAARCMNGLSHSLAKLGYISTFRMTMPPPVSSSMCSKDVGFRLLVLPRYLMQRLTVNETTSRPWAVAYVSHSRILAGPRDEAGPRQRGVWTGFLVWVFFDFAISFWTVFRWPRLLRQRHEGCLFSCMFLSFKYRFNGLMFFSTHTDQLLMSGSEPPPLPQLLQALQAMHQTSKKVSGIVFTAVVPCSFFPPQYILFLTDSYRYVPCYHPCS